MSDSVKVKFETTKGDFILEVQPSWAPQGAARLLELVDEEFFDGCRFFRVVEGFMAQFGIHGDPERSAVWRNNNIPDDPVNGSNVRGTVSFATAGPGTRTTQLFLNFGDNSFLDSQGFSPIGSVIEGMDEVVDKLHSEYGDGPPSGRGPRQDLIQRQGNAYLEREFAKLDHIISARRID